MSAIARIVKGLCLSLSRSIVAARFYNRIFIAVDKNILFCVLTQFYSFVYLAWYLFLYSVQSLIRYYVK